MRLLLITHAALGRQHGAGLSDAALSRAAEIGRALPQARAAYSSPAPAALQSAQAMGLTPCPDPGLADWDRQFESIDELVDRIGRWLAERQRESGTRAAVTHAAVVRAAVLAVLGAPVRQFEHIDVAPSSVTTLGVRDGRWLLTGLSWEPELLHIPQRRGRRRARPQ